MKKSQNFSDEELVKIYNNANNIPKGKAPPITTERIFTAMRYCLNYEEEKPFEVDWSTNSNGGDY